MSEMAHMAVVYDRVKQAMLESGEVVSAKDYERLVKCCAKMVEILETCVQRSESVKDNSFARDVRVYMNVVKGLLEDPFFVHAKFKWQDARKESMSWADMWQAQRDAQAQVDAENAAKAPKKRGRKPRMTVQQRMEKYRKYQRDYQRNYRKKQKAQKLGLQQFEIVDGKWANPTEATKKTEFAKQQRARKKIMTDAVKAKLKALKQKKGK